ncbi:MAG: hypothetical protein IT574_01725 [Candidatus Aureabacteria bacterium]|nr:hypothetical protein [Candidatus Auribacterota bacterium]NLW94342.1 hypothetical protein [Chlamydiota bacterium]HOE26265.1 hypothetical protein [bacterium]HQM52624.1 hypothetical protein [bacterium]
MIHGAVRVLAAGALCVPALAFAQPRVKGAEGVAKAEAIIEAGKVAPAEFSKAAEVIKAGNEALQKGDEANAYCYFEEGVMRLNELKSRFPDWERDTVMKQIVNTLEVKNKLVATTCQNLEEMKEARFRFEVWQRQVVMLRKLDLIQEQLNRMEKLQDKHDEYIKDIRDTLRR